MSINSNYAVVHNIIEDGNNYHIKNILLDLIRNYPGDKIELFKSIDKIKEQKN